MSKKKKRIKGVSPLRGENIRAPLYGDDLPDDHRRPIFSLELLSRDFCISRCERDEKAAFADKLREISSLTWGQLREAGRHGQGYERIPRSSIKAGVPNFITPDVDSFIAFRCIGKAPMVGHRIRQVFYVIWIDRQFKLYDHG